VIQRPPTRLLAAGVGIVAVALVVVGWTFLRSDGEETAESVQEWNYVTMPEVTPPTIDVSKYEVPGQRRATDDEGLIFIAPKDGESMTGALIVNSDGTPVWIGPQDRLYDLRVQQYQGKPVITYWRGDTILPYYGSGEFVLLNQQYEEIATVTTHGPPAAADYHEMTLTDEGTALMIGHRLVRRDLSFKGGAHRGWVADGIVQEVDVATGKVLWRWSALDHIPINQSMTGLNRYGSGIRSDPYDYAHLNSITEDGDGAFLISARNTSAVYRVDRATGNIDWTLGGKASDFAMSPHARFYWQHDAQRQSDGTITLFDNEGAPPKAKRSRGLRLALDMKTHTARVVTEYLPPDQNRLSGSQGNVQVMPGGHVFVGWGSRHYFSEFTADGDLLLDGDFGTGESYRSYRSPWVGKPSYPPTLTVDDGTAYVSWNGATEVASWRFLAGDDPESVRDVGTVRREGFETSAEIPDAPYIAVQALDADGNVLATVER
jgi:hypothetical protein